MSERSSENIVFEMAASTLNVLMWSIIIFLWANLAMDLYYLWWLP